MTQANDNFLKLQRNYLFRDIADKVKAFQTSHPEAHIISLGIGDVTQPLAPAVIQAMHKAVEEMGHEETFHGYGPEQGYEFLRQAIVDGDFRPRGIEMDIDEVFVSDGAKSDTGNIGDILSSDSTVGVTDPIYPVYIDSNVMSGRAGALTPQGLWNRITYMPCTAANDFTPEIPDHKVDIIYLCYPNNPTGTVISRQQLQQWVDYARRWGSLIMYDAAYEAYIQDPEIPHSIYEIEGAKECAIEFHSYSKTAGFTGTRCGYTIVPKALKAYSDGQPVSLNQLWTRRQSTKYNGTSYITQRGAAATYTPEGRAQIQETIQYYMTNARLMLQTLAKAGFTTYGGHDSPYIWLKTPDGVGSWQFFETLLHQAHLVSTPGVGFGPSGEGYIRLTAFGKRQDCEEAMKRIIRL